MPSPRTTPAGTQVASAADAVRGDLRRRLIAARTSRDATAVAALRIAIAAIDNAESPAVSAPSTALSPSAHVVGSALGLGTTEVDRVRLAEHDVLAILRHEIDERIAFAAEYEELGEREPAAELRAQADVLEAIVADWGR